MKKKLKKWLSSDILVYIILGISLIFWIIPDLNMSSALLRQIIFSIALTLALIYFFYKTYKQVDDGKYMNFFKFCGLILLITFAVILVFASYFKLSTDIGKGVMTHDDQNISLNALESISFSAHTFFSTGYVESVPHGFAKTLVLLEIAMNYMLFVLFVSFIASHPDIFFRKKVEATNKKPNNVTNGRTR